MDSSDNRKMDEELKKAVSRACKQVMKSLEQEPSVRLEGEDTDDVPDSLIREIETWLFKRRGEDGCTDNRSDQ